MENGKWKVGTSKILAPIILIRNSYFSLSCAVGTEVLTTQ